MQMNQSGAGSSNARPRPFFTTLVAAGGPALDVFLGEFFRAEGHVILHAGTPAEALAKTREHQPDLILLDNELGDGGAVTLLPELLLEHAGASVIVMATRPNVGEAVESMKLGAADYLERPLDAGRLKRAIDLQKTLFMIR